MASVILALRNSHSEHLSSRNRASLNSESISVDEATEAQRVKERAKEQGLIFSFPAEHEVVGDVELDLLMMNGYIASVPSHLMIRFPKMSFPVTQDMTSLDDTGNDI